MQSREYSVIVLYENVLATPLLGQGDGGGGGGVEWGGGVWLGKEGRNGDADCRGEIRDRRCRLRGGGAATCTSCR